MDGAESQFLTTVRVCFVFPTPESLSPLLSILSNANDFFFSQEGRNRNIFYDQEESLYYSWINYRMVFM